MNQYFHKYKGIVVQNDDPEGMGRVKVFVPEISMTLFKDWNSDKEKDKKFTELGANLGSSITPELLERLKIALPWGMVKQPVFGCTETTYHNDIDFGEIANDEDNSAQHDKINKQLAASSPENNAFIGALASAMKTSGAAAAPVDSASIINNYQNPSTSNAADNYLNNVTQAEPADEKLLNPSLITASNPSSADSNINSITINFNPNARGTQPRNIPRRFTTNATISEVGETPFSGQSSATGVGVPTTKVFTGTTTPVYSPPITYVHSPLPAPPTTPITSTQTPTLNPNPSLITAGPATTPTLGTGVGATTFSDTLGSNATGARGPTTVSDRTISVNFVPNSRGLTPIGIRRVFTSQGSISVQEGSSPLENANFITPNAGSVGQGASVFSDSFNASATGVGSRTTVTDGFFTATFTPNSRGVQPRNIPRVFTTSASITVYDGESISFPDPQDPSINTKVFKNDITSIVIGYDSAHKPINLQAADLGGLGDLLAEYSGSGSTGMVDSPISPPSSISSVFNRGGGGGELFTLVFSTLLPLATLLNCLVGNTNPSSKQTINQKKKEKIDNGSDPNKTVGVNQQTSADCKPAMRSPTQNNKVKGMISIPAVGAKVAVYFDNGNPMYPIIDGVFYTQEGYAGLNDSAS
jgi:hypothetical protein